MTTAHQHTCRTLHGDEVTRGLAILHDAYDWLSDRGIRQWTQPLSFEVYSEWQEQDYNYGVFEDSELAAVFSLVWGSLDEWPNENNAISVLWLHALATCRGFLGRGVGEHAVKYAVDLAAKVSDDLYLSCAYGTGYLPGYYQRLGFQQLSREVKHYGQYGAYDMVLMQYTLDRPNNTLHRTPTSGAGEL